MPVTTCGIQMSKNDTPGQFERLTGGNAVADEGKAAELALLYVKKLSGERVQWPKKTTPKP